MASKQSLPDFSHSMTDLMASVAVMFLLIAAVFMLKETAQKAKTEEKYKNVSTLQQDSLALLKTLVAKLEAREDLAGAVQLDPQDPFVVTVEFPQREAYFAFDKAELRPDAAEALVGSLADVVKQVCVIPEGYTNSIILEGHSDRRGPLRRNVALSSDRAQAVYFAVRDRLEAEKDSVGLDCIDSRFTVAGRGPVAPKNWEGSWNDTLRPQDPADRRVVLKVRFTSGGEELQRE